MMDVEHASKAFTKCNLLFMPEILYASLNK